MKSIIVSTTILLIIFMSCKEEEYVPTNAGKEIKHLSGTWILEKIPQGIFFDAQVYDISFCLDNCYWILNGKKVNLNFEYEVRTGSSSAGVDEPILPGQVLSNARFTGFEYAKKESDKSLSNYDDSIILSFDYLDESTMIMRNYLGDTLKYYKVQLPN